MFRKLMGPGTFILLWKYHKAAMRVKSANRAQTKKATLKPLIAVPYQTPVPMENTP